jgi:hypothetical protein
MLEETSDTGGKRVLKVEQKEQIRRAFYIEGKSVRQIAREQHHCRRHGQGGHPGR